MLAVSTAISSVIAKEKEWSVEPLPVGCLDGTMPYGLYCFERPAGKSGRYEWDMVGERTRRALFLAISNKDGQTVYLLEIEGKGEVSYSLFLFRAVIGGFDRTIGARALMFEIADSSGSKIKDEILKNFVVTSMKHTESQSDSFEERLQRAIRGVFGEMGEG